MPFHPSARFHWDLFLKRGAMRREKGLFTALSLVQYAKERREETDTLKSKYCVVKKGKQVSHSFCLLFIFSPPPLTGPLHFFSPLHRTLLHFLHIFSGANFFFFFSYQMIFFPPKKEYYHSNYHSKLLKILQYSNNRNRLTNPHFFLTNQRLNIVYSILSSKSVYR